MFSIIIPVYNVELYLKNCIESILNQPFQDYEIILVNDGSTDSSGKICDKYKSKDSRIQVIHKKNEGLSQARNEGMNIAKGKYIVFVDSDDWINKDALGKLANIIEWYNNPDIIINRISSYYQDLNTIIECKYKFDIEKLNKMTSEDIFTTCYNMDGFWGAAWCFVARKDYIEKNNLYFEKGLLHEDEDWSPILIMKAKTIGFNNDCFYCNRANRQGSITDTLNIQKEFDKIKIINRLKKETKKDIYDSKKKKVLLSRCSSLYVGILIKLTLYKQKKDKRYDSLISNMKNNRRVLLYGSKKINKIVYIFSYIIGVENVGRIITKCGERKC